MDFPNSIWTKVSLGIGYHEDNFTLGFVIVYEEDFDAAIAVDDITLSECGQPPAEEDCQVWSSIMSYSCPASPTPAMLTIFMSY